MNPVLIIIVLILAALLWLLLSFTFRFIGKLVSKLVDDAKHAMLDEDNENKEGREEE